MDDNGKKSVIEDATGVHVDDVRVVEDGTGEAMGLVVHGHMASECPAARASAEVDRKGPAKVVSDAYRDGYDRIFGGGSKVTYEA